MFVKYIRYISNHTYITMTADEDGRKARWDHFIENTTFHGIRHIFGSGQFRPRRYVRFNYLNANYHCYFKVCGCNVKIVVDRHILNRSQ